ncbi:MAG: hemerythrin domain-containing protein [Actinomycetota bacterium]|nr:hemerythrin domain-containing protein [Actinomycetota bacterium]
MAQRDAVDVIVSDHRHVEALFSRVETGPTLDQAVLDELIRELSIHAGIEEQVLYPAIRNKVDGGEGIADHSLDEHQEAKELLASIEKGGVDDPQTPELLRKLIASVREHVQEEEGQILPKLRSSIAPEALITMGEALEKAKSMAPTHPHPRAPSTPPGNVIAGAPTALVDKARDAIKGR